MMQAFRQTPGTEVSRRLAVSSDDAVAAIGAAVMLESFLQTFNAVCFSCFSISTREAAVELMIREEVICENEPFRKELRSICRAIGHKYGFDGEHAETVAMTAAKLFDALKEEFKFPARRKCSLKPPHCFTISAVLWIPGITICTPLISFPPPSSPD